jgi:hypothetical protein
MNLEIEEYIYNGEDILERWNFINSIVMNIDTIESKQIIKTYYLFNFSVHAFLKSTSRTNENIKNAHHFSSFRHQLSLIN